MRIDAAPRRAKRLSLTSLIDVIFLLLLFFMLTSTFTRFAQVEVATAGQGGATAAKPGILLRLTAAGFEVNGEMTEAEGLADRLAMLKQTGATSGLVLVGEDARSQDMVTALEGFRAAGLDVSVAH